MISRRLFLVGSVAVAGGVAFGFREFSQLPPRLPAVPVGEGQTALTPYVVIDADGITLIAPRAEMGQGIHTTLAALVAEELDVALEDVRVVHGPASEHYANEIFYGPRPHAGRIHGEPTQATGGQTSIRDGFVKMRKAGAAARIALVEAASDRLGVAPSALTTQGGKVVAPDGTALAYAELAEAAARVDLPEDPPLRRRSEWRVLGTSQQRVDMVGKCTGTAEFGIDVQLPGLLYGTVVRNPGIGAGMRGFDASGAEAMPGVHRVVPLEQGVVVIADTTWHAFRAAERIVFDWAPPVYPATTAEHRAAVEAQFDGPAHDTPVDAGDVEAALAGAEVIEGAYRVPYLAHATMEPLNATAHLADGKLDIWCGNQFPTLAVKIGAHLAGLSQENVRVHTPYMGGGFGRRFEMDDVEAAVHAALAVPGRPVRVTYRREEDFTHDSYRPMASARFRAALRDGAPVALDLRLAAPSLFYSGEKRKQRILDGPDKPVPERDISLTMGAREQPYRIANLRVAAFRAPELLPVGWWRSVGESQNCFFLESAIDELAHAAGRDPLEFRLSLIDDAPSRKVLEAVARMSDWGAELPTGKARGVAYCFSSGGATAQVLQIAVTDHGIRVERAWAALDVGIALDPRNIEGQVQGALIFGLSAAIHGEITVADGAVQQRNYDTYPLLRMDQAPLVEVEVHEGGGEITGCGESGTPTAAPALGNAIFAATGRRLRSLPFGQSIDFA